MKKLLEFSGILLNQNSLRSIYGGKDIETCLDDYPECKDTLAADGMTHYPDDLPCSEKKSECDANCQ